MDATNSKIQTLELPEKIPFQVAIINDKLILTSPKIKAELGSSDNQTPLKVEAN